MKRATAVIACVAAGLALGAAPAGGASGGPDPNNPSGAPFQPKKCGAVDFSGVKTEISPLSRVSCRKAIQVARRFARFQSIGSWRCAVARDGARYRGYAYGFSCGAGGTRGDLKRWPRAFIGLLPEAEE